MKTVKVNTEWTTATGKVIAIKDMDTTHIKNSINKIKKSGGVWRGEYLEVLENELKRRNLSITESNESDLIAEKEKIYFLETSCESKVIKFKKSEFTDFSLSEKSEDFLLNNYFVLDSEDSIDDFKFKLKKDIKNISQTEFYEKYSKYLLDNIFTKEWKVFIDLMLGRKFIK